MRILCSPITAAVVAAVVAAVRDACHDKIDSRTQNAECRNHSTRKHIPKRVCSKVVLLMVIVSFCLEVIRTVSIWRQEPRR